jgi:uncharacterized protein GlcG (DUF336 family)
MSGVRFFAYATAVAALTGIFLPSGDVRAGEPEANAAGVLTQALADSMAQRCLSQSKGNGWPPFTIAVVDSSGTLLLLRRQDAAAAVTADVAALKAKSAVRTGAPTQALATMAQDPPTHDLLLLLQLTDDPGGLPVRINGRLAGAIGVSGGTADQDIGCATAAVAALPSEKK